MNVDNIVAAVQAALAQLQALLQKVSDFITSAAPIIGAVVGVVAPAKATA